MLQQMQPARGQQHVNWCRVFTLPVSCLLGTRSRISLRTSGAKLHMIKLVASGASFENASNAHSIDIASANMIAKKLSPPTTIQHECETLRPVLTGLPNIVLTPRGAIALVAMQPSSRYERIT